MPQVRFDTYYRYADLTRILKGYAAQYPALVRIESIGHSHEGRDIWLLTVTDASGRPDGEKPALWVDGNIHASEVSTSSACLYLIEALVTGYGQDPEITRCLDTRVFYICPRINPDGAEWALGSWPKIVRSSTRPYPYDEEPIGGLAVEDLDGDGRILHMRIPDPTGQWKTDDEDRRLLVRRDPAEVGGRYFRLLPEGRLDEYDGVTIALQPAKERLDLNRNFPPVWREEHQQPGAGPYPASEPEVRAVVDFAIAHPNLTGAVDFHTYSGVILRPYADRPDESFAPEDLAIYKKIGERAAAITGYPAISIFHDFRYQPKDIFTGGMDALMFEHLGLFFWAVELWSPQRAAGIEVHKHVEWFREHPVEDDRALLRWSDKDLDGQGYIAWYPFEHPQLGEVELGGWDTLYAFRNPPPHLLQAEIARFPAWLVWQLLLSPLLELHEATAIPLGERTYLVRLVVQNTGWLPSYVTKKALEKRAVRGLICEITLPEGASLAVGQVRMELGQLEGRAATPLQFGWTMDPTDHRLKVEWVVRAPYGGDVGLVARHERAGVVRAIVHLAEAIPPASGRDLRLKPDGRAGTSAEAGWQGWNPG